MADLGFWAIAADDPGHRALVEADGRETSAGELLAGGNQLARGLQALGLQRGDVVAALLPNRREMVELALGAGRGPLSTRPPPSAWPAGCSRCSASSPRATTSTWCRRRCTTRRR